MYFSSFATCISVILKLVFLFLKREFGGADGGNSVRSSAQAAARTAIQRWTKRSQRSQLPRLCTIPSSPQLGARLNLPKIQRTKSKIQKWSIQWWLACPKSKVQIPKFRYQRPHYSLCLAYYVFQAQNWTHVPKCNNPNLFPKFKIPKFPECVFRPKSQSLGN